MEVDTKDAVRILRDSNKQFVNVDGEEMSVLAAMSYSISFHHMDIEEVDGELIVKGTDPV